MQTEPLSEHILAPELSLAQIGDLKAEIRQVLSGPTILGSQLGGLIIRAASILGATISLRKFGGLRKFANEHLRDLVALKFSHGPGQPELYDVLIQSGDGTMSTSPRAPMALNQKFKKLFWSAITNPYSKFSIEKQNDDLVCSIRQADENISSNSLPPLDIEEYKAIVSSFISTVPGSIKLLATEILESTTSASLNKTWTNFLYAKCTPEVIQAWQRHRIENLIDLFKKKAIASGITQEKIDSYILFLNEPNINSFTTGLTKNRAKPLNRDSFLTTKSQGGQSELSSSNATPLQLIVIDIITRMSDDQLRQLNLPFGLSFDSTQRSLR